MSKLRGLRSDGLVMQERCSSARLLSLLFLFVLSGCASLDSTAPEAAVSQRSVERAELLMRADFASAYLYTTPGYRSLETVDEYASRWVGATMWQDAKVADVKCQGDPAARCQLALAVTFSSLQTGLVTTHLQETWVKSGRYWYLFQDVGS